MVRVYVYIIPIFLSSFAALNRKTLLVHLALFTVALLYAANFSIAKWAMPEFISSYAFIVVRVGMGMVFFMLYYFLKVKEKVEKSDYKDLIICGLFGVALNMSCFFKGLSMTSSINASVLMLMAPVFVVIFNAIGSKTKIKSRVYLGIIIAFLGAGLIVNITEFSIGGKGVLGDLLITINAISYAFYLFYVSRLLRKYSPFTITAFIFFFGFFMVLPFGISDLMLVEWTTMPLQAYFAIGYVVIGVTILAYLLNAWGLQRSSSTTVGSYIYLQPFLATLIAVGLGMDTLKPSTAVYGGLILIGLYLVNTGK